MKKKYYVVYDLVEARPWFNLVVGDIPKEDWSRYMIAEISEGSYNTIRCLALTDVLPCEKWTLEMELDPDAPIGVLYFEDAFEADFINFPILSFRDARFPDKLFEFSISETLAEMLSHTENKFTVNHLAPAF